jgi:hypothetical protein
MVPFSYQQTRRYVIANEVILGTSEKPILLKLGCLDRVQAGSGVSEVQAAFVTSLAGQFRDRPDRITHSGNPEPRTDIFE